MTKTQSIDAVIMCLGIFFMGSSLYKQETQKKRHHDDCGVQLEEEVVLLSEHVDCNQDQYEGYDGKINEFQHAQPPYFVRNARALVLKITATATAMQTKNGITQQTSTFLYLSPTICAA